MRKRSAIFLLIVLFCGIIPQTKVGSEPLDYKDDLVGYLKTLTPELVLKQANEDMKNLYGRDNYYPTRTQKGAFNAALVQKQIDEGIKNPQNFTGFDIVYGTSHGTKITHKGREMYRYSGYNKFGDPVSTDGFPWDAGWSGVPIHKLRLKPTPWEDMGNVNDFDNFPSRFNREIPEKLYEYLPHGNFEKQILKALNTKYAGVAYGDYLMYNNKDSEYATRKVYYTNGAPEGGWIKYLHIIQPPTYLSQGFGRVYMRSTYLDIPIAAFAATQGSDLSVSFDDLPSQAVAGETVNVSVMVESTFANGVTPAFSWSITRAGGGALTKETDQLSFNDNAHYSQPSGTIPIGANKERRLTASFTMPDSDVRIQFKVNENGTSPKETVLANNTVESTIKVVKPIQLPYDMLTKKEKIILPANTVTLKLPDWEDARWTGNAVGELKVYNRNPDLLRDFKVFNNMVNEASESITRAPVVTYTIMRKDFGINGKKDDPENKQYVNLSNPDDPLLRIGELYYEGSVSRPYQYTEHEQVCTGSGENEKCETRSRTKSGTVTAEFDSGNIKKPYAMYVYNGKKELEKYTYRDEIEKNSGSALEKKLFWTNEPYYYPVIRWMHHQDENGQPYNWTRVPGQYKREFIQQASGGLTLNKTSSLETEYSQSRKAAAGRTNKKSLYDKAVFATDKQLQKYAYPIKSGYYFNPAGSYTFTLNTVVFKDKKPQNGEMTQDHKDLVNSLIGAFRYESDLIYINNKKEAVNILNEGLAPKGGGFVRKKGVLTVEQSKGVNGEKLIDVLDRSDDPSRYTQDIYEVFHSEDTAENSTHEFWKRVLEGYSESKTAKSHSKYKYREYVKDGEHMYKITETSKITIVVNPENKYLYTHANMPNGNYSIKVWFDDINLKGFKHAYKVLGTLKGVEELDSMKITVIGSMFDDLNS